MKIVIIGGHHISALVLAEYLRANGHNIIWFGTRYPRWPEKTIGSEYKQVKKRGFPFVEIRAGKFHKNAYRWPRIPLGFYDSFINLRKLKPNVIVSFGGYLAAPVVLAGWLAKIPSFTHEQTATAGLANKLLSHFVKKVFIAWPQSKRYFPKNKTLYTGLPLRRQFKQKIKKKLFSGKLPTILIAGGKQGSHIINLSVKPIIKILLKQFNVIHQTGDILDGKDYESFTAIKNKLPPDLKKRYLLKKFFGDKEWLSCLSSADFCLCRAGAHTVYELAYLGKPAIFIPLPFSYADEQQKNAEIFSKNNAGEIIEQKYLNSKKLLEKILAVEKKLPIYKKNAENLKKTIPSNAEEVILSYIQLPAGKELSGLCHPERSRRI